MSPKDDREAKVIAFLAEKTGIPSPQAGIRVLVRTTVRRAYGSRPLHLPMDLNLLSRCLQVSDLRWDPEIKAEATLLPLGETFTITLRSSPSRSSAHQRFSWAHELCHVHFHEKRNGTWVRAVPNGSNLEERLCDIGAQELLMPETPLMKVIQSLGKSSTLTRTALRAAANVGVSVQAIVLRAKQLGLWENVAFASFKCQGVGPDTSMLPAWTVPAEDPPIRFASVRVGPPSALHDAYRGGEMIVTSATEDWILPRQRTVLEMQRYAESRVLVAASPP